MNLNLSAGVGHRCDKLILTGGDCCKRMPALGEKTEEDKLRTLRTTTNNLSQRIKIILIVRYMRIISSLILAVDASLAVSLLLSEKQEESE